MSTMYTSAKFCAASPIVEISQFCPISLVSFGSQLNPTATNATTKFWHQQNFTKLFLNKQKYHSFSQQIISMLKGKKDTCTGYIASLAKCMHHHPPLPQAHTVSQSIKKCAKICAIKYNCKLQPWYISKHHWVLPLKRYQICI